MLRLPRLLLMLALLALWLVPAPAQSADDKGGEGEAMQIWTDATGRRFEGRIIDFDGEQVTFQTNSGEIDLLLDQLGSNDQYAILRNPRWKEKPADRLRVVARHLGKDWTESYDHGIEQGRDWFKWLFWGGMALMALGLLMLVVAAFRTGLWWGLGTLLIPGLFLIFSLANWDRSQSGLVTFMTGLTLIALAFLAIDQGWLPLEAI